MNLFVWKVAVVVLLSVLVGCSDGPDAPVSGLDTGVSDAGDAGPDADIAPDEGDAETDAVADAAGDLPRDVEDEARDVSNDADSGGADAAGDAEGDAHDADAGIECEEDDPQPPFGTQSGPCGVLTEQVLEGAEPFFLRNQIDFGDDPYDEADFCRIAAGSREVITDENAGGSSLLSEAFAFELLHRCEGAVLLKTETEIVYRNSMGKLTDILVALDGRKIGVSVTRAVGFPRDEPYTVERAQQLLERKLQGVLDSTANVAPEDEWVKQILYVIAYSPMHADSMEEAWGQIDSTLQADTIVIVTVSDGDDEWLY
jgi:hypothetical protein